MGIILKRKETFFLLLITILFTSSCATVKSVPSGFLDDYSSLDCDKSKKDLCSYFSPSKSIDKYSKILISPAVVYFSPEAKGEGIDPDKLKELTDVLSDEIEKAFADNFSIVYEPGNDVLLIRTAITEIVSNKPIFNIAPHYTLAIGFGLGGASMEAEFVDSISGERVFAITYGRKGKRRKYTKGLTKWGHTKDVLKEWANMLREELDKIQSE